MSVLSALLSIGIDAKLIQSQEDISNSDRLIIPGVGHVESIVQEMDELDYRDAILNFAARGNFLLGICLGQHLLGLQSEESPASNTLGILDFKVNRLQSGINSSFRVPHVGWNSIEFENDHEIFRNVATGSDFYFSHSYAITGITALALASTDHSTRFTSVAGKDNVLSVQFHPEKSQRVGRQLLMNFCEL